MAHDDGGWPDKVVLLQPRGRRPVKREGLAPVTALPGSEPGEPLRGDEEWISTLPDPPDTTAVDTT